MLALRVHLDDSGEDNGALRVIPGSHRLGRLTAEQIHEVTAVNRPVTCVAPCGSALLMKPLLLHASSAAKSPSHRRVVHVEFASAELPSGLRWLTD
jgi:ectoine hydroxylase-related dioxygenase (phytanoyl-CoA dioxygenase family)